MPPDHGPLFQWKPATPEPSLPTEPEWRAARNEAMEQVEEHAGPSFADQAHALIVKLLRERGPQSGEALSMACRAAGVTPHDDRAFGPVYLRLVRAGTIEKCGTVARRRGHGTAGGNVWRLAGGR